MVSSTPRAWAEISLARLLENHRLLRAHCSMDSMAILKADAYGHGALAVAHALENSSTPPAFFGLASIAEARQLQENNLRTPLYLLGPSAPFEREEIILRRAIPCLSSLEEALSFNTLAANLLPPHDRLTVHLALDTGMGRGGFLPHELLANIQRLRSLQHLDLQGIGSHLSKADEDPHFTKCQCALFDQIVEQTGPWKWKHLCNSAGLINFQSSQANLARPGLGLYGISPVANSSLHLLPALSLKAHITLIRHLPAGHSISYGADTILQKDTTVATVGIGYADGYSRNLPPLTTHVWVKGQPCPLLGRVTMDQIMIDVSAIDAIQAGQQVELWGDHIDISKLATQASTIPWVLLTSLSPRVARCYTPLNP